MYSQDSENSADICSNKDYGFFYEGLRNRKILIQKCEICGLLRNPPSPMCSSCNSLDWHAVEMAGKGSIFSYTIHHYPAIPGFDTPHPIGVIELDEGVRMVAGLDGILFDRIEIGAPVQAEFITRSGVASVRFRLSDGSHRMEIS